MKGFFFDTEKAAQDAADKINATFQAPENSETTKYCEYVSVKDFYFIPFTDRAAEILNAEPETRNFSNAING